jgi:hypothetical protein
MAPHRTPVLRRGVSLVEALVALAVMAFGMLALVGVQTTMRLNSDVAKQRGEATRIATEEIERLRGFETIDVVLNEAAYASYDGMAPGTPAYDAAGNIGNTTYTITRIVIPAADDLPFKSIAVRVNWTDRSNQPQSVILETAISGTNPALAGLLPFQRMPTASATNQRSGRHASIPAWAEDRGHGFSWLTPPGSTGIAWLFNNLTGVMRECNAVGESCVDVTRVSGTVAFHISAAAVTESDASHWAGPASNLGNWPHALALTAIDGAPVAKCSASPATNDSPFVNYTCSVSPSGWGGRLDLRLLDSSGSQITPGTTDQHLRVCRFTKALTDITVNLDHPARYCMEMSGLPPSGEVCTGRRVNHSTLLADQNFLVIRGDQACPYVNVAPVSRINARPHQP